MWCGLAAMHQMRIIPCVWQWWHGMDCICLCTTQSRHGFCIPDEDISLLYCSSVGSYESYMAGDVSFIKKFCDTSGRLYCCTMVYLYYHVCRNITVNTVRRVDPQGENHAPNPISCGVCAEW